MTYTIRYGEDAIDDLKEIRTWYDEISLSATEKDNITNPFAFSKTGYTDFRRAIIKRFPYKIIFRVTKNIIDVFGVIHFSRSNRYIKRRLKK